MSNNIQITTARLVLRPIRPEDSASVFTYRSNSTINQFQGWIPKTPDDVLDFIANQTSPEINLPETWFQFVICKKDTSELIGDIGVHFLDLSGFQVELGCTLNLNYQGKGFAFEALKEVINYLFDELNKHRITASIDPGNEKSIRLFTRLGFRKEAHFKQSVYQNGEWTDDFVFAILKDEW